MLEGLSGAKLPKQKKLGRAQDAYGMNSISLKRLKMLSRLSSREEILFCPNLVPLLILVTDLEPGFFQ